MMGVGAKRALGLYRSCAPRHIQGTIAAIELDPPGGYLADAGRRMRRVCLEKGVWLRPLGNVLYALPPFRTSRASLEQIADAMEAALADVLASEGHSD